MWSNGRVIGSQWVNLDQSANPSCLLALQYIFVKCINFQPAREKFFMWTQLKKFYGDVPPEKIIDWWGGCGLQCKDFTFFFSFIFYFTYLFQSCNTTFYLLSCLHVFGQVWLSFYFIYFLAILCFSFRT
jgi:hypothetical protein